MSDPLTYGPRDSAYSPVVVISTTPPTHDPPPPYPSQERRTRTPRTGRRRRTLEQASENATSLTISSGGAEHDAFPPTIHQQFESDDQDADVTETTPLLVPSGSSPRIPARVPPGVMGRQRTLSLTSTIRSTTSIAPSLAQTVLSAFNPERDCDIDADCDDRRDSSDSADSSPLDSPTLRQNGPLDDQQRAFVAELIGQRVDRRRDTSLFARWRRYYRPLGKRAYYASLFHLLVINFPYALLAWLYLFVFTVAGTTTLMALPLGAVLCFIDLIGARTLSRGEIALQMTFHGPLAHSRPTPPLPIFVRTRPPTVAELEQGLGPVPEKSFYRNAYAMFTDATSYQALFYFLVIKPGITVLIFLLLIVLVPLSFVLVLPAPATLRLARRLGIWQANIAVEGLCLAMR
ncbi:uncharacterized protein C8Q71DRAFT_747565 [Rhodofomes roseus]|uniref:Sensor domain-containing protein n=1 Tax=Rhodofomes roseus TaxID=34475 RepID=A0ABQ8KL78_9APHY|nr:uncharacterized protein C8Q71DRAFT_747565 [Rhodofomes roseus]KAH9839072.1 hypothetical protein C8Q71DRAFT_747565 [Rhodofomes roseus]